MVLRYWSREDGTAIIEQYQIKLKGGEKGKGRCRNEKGKGKRERTRKGKEISWRYKPQR